jgi:hypothetical protein
VRLRQATGVSNECSCGLTGLVPDEDRAWTICVGVVLVVWGLPWRHRRVLRRSRLHLTCKEKS